MYGQLLFLVLPWIAGYAECVNFGKSEWNEDQAAFFRQLDEFRLEIQRRDQEIMAMAAKMKTLEEQHQADVEELRTRLEEKNRLIEKKTQSALQAVQDRNRISNELTELKDHMDIKDRKINVLQRKIENLEDLLKEKDNQVDMARARLSAMQAHHSNSEGAMTSLEEAIAFQVLKNVKQVAKTQNKMKYLNVAEKNDAAKTISGFLSRGTARRREGLSVYNKIYEFDTIVRGNNSKMVMTSVSGHLLTYEFVSTYKGWKNCDPVQLFDAPVRKTCPQDSEKILKTLEREVKSCQGLIIWTDCDREGENIGFEIIEVCKRFKPNISVYRAKFSEITSNSIRRALDTLTQPDQKQSNAVDIRQQLDLRIGAAFTRFQTLRLQRIFPNQIAEKLISYGSCQIPTLGFVAQRYKESEEFISEQFWKLKVTHTIDDLTVDFIWARNRLFDKEACEDYLMLCLTDPIAKVTNVVTKPKSKWRPNPMDTVELEKLGSRKLKISAKTTMTIAEKLYSRGYISYPRTETNCFSNDIDLKSLVELQIPHSDWGSFASKVIEWSPNPRNGKKSDQAHPPIHPTKYATDLQGNDQRVYELIVRHFLACVSKDAVGSETIVDIIIAGEKFSATGLCIFERNYLDVYPYEKWNAKQIHRYEIGSRFEPTEICMQEGATTAPPLLTEADLISLMEKNGIGTDATHAEHIHTIKERGYIGEIERGFLVPGTIGMGLYEGYNAMELTLAQPKLRADFEIDLKKICTGEKAPEDVLKQEVDRYKSVYSVISEKAQILDEKIGVRLQETPSADIVEEIPTPRMEQVFECPKCSALPMVLKLKQDKTSYFLGCLGFPECKNVIWFDTDIRDIEVSTEICSKCGPGYRKLEIKFKNSYYLTHFNATSNTYKTCLSCDERFREAFKINIDSVKKCGPIVSNISISNNNRAITSTNRHNSNPGTHSTISTNSSRYRGWYNNTTENVENNRNSAVSETNSNINNSNDENNYMPGSNQNTSNRQDAVRCTKCNKPTKMMAVKKPGPNNGRSFYSCGNASCNFFQWADSDTNENARSYQENEELIIQCTCNKPAKRLTVNKDGPNKGRQFYKCEANICRFFQWSEEEVNGTEGIRWGTGRQNATIPSGSSGNSTAVARRQNSNTRKRKCGLCRQEGHTKLKCPRREEFGDL